LVSTQAKALVGLIIAGLPIGFVLALLDPSGNLLLAFLQSNDAVEHGAVWQLLTSVIVAPPIALGLEDVGFNAIAVVVLDGYLSAVYDPLEYFATFTATAVFGNLFSLLAGPGQVSFGASGGIFGLLAGLVTFDYATQRRVSYTLLLWFAFIFVFSSFFLGNVDWEAHAGGAILGFAIGYWIGRRRTPEYY
jgi:membrane associated rhomboid family serine protease